MKNEFFIYLKLLAINPETGKTYVPVCQMQPQIVVNLYNFIHEFRRVEEDNSEAYRAAVEEVLQKTQSAFGCPIGWLIEMQSTDEFFAMDNPFYQPEIRHSSDFLYSPEIGKTEIEVGFMYQWALEALPTFRASKERAE